MSRLEIMVKQVHSVLDGTGSVCLVLFLPCVHCLLFICLSVYPGKSSEDKHTYTDHLLEKENVYARNTGR